MDKKQIEIRLTTPEVIHPLRARILRPGQPLSASHYPGEEGPTWFHLGAFDGDRIIGCASWQPEAVNFKDSTKPYRLRGMATDQSYQGQGIGRRLLQESFKFLRQQGVDFVWCNAREVAFGFYEKQGFNYHGGLFDIPKIGPHKVMFRVL